MGRNARVPLLFAGLLTCVLHCSVLVEDQLSELRCSQEGALGPPACDPGQVCATGRCHACVALEVCGDRIDNDCNGQVDDRCRWAASGGAGGDAAGGNGGVTGVAGNDRDSN